MRRRPVPRDRLPPGRLDDGLAADEAVRRTQRFGPNDVVERVSRPWWTVVRETVADPMLWFLAATAAVYALLGDRLEAVTLAALVVPIVGMDAFLHRRSSASVAGLATRLASRATARRDGAWTTLPALALVPGDVVRVGAGEPCPADGVVVAGEGVQVEESALTGEAWPARKRPLATLPEGDVPAVATEHWAFAGTRVLTGPALVCVVYTGRETLYGEIVRSAVAGVRARTPMQAAIASLVATLTAAAGVLCVLLALVRVRQGFGWIDAVVSAATLAVAALPEEFPVVFTVFLGVGVHRLARRQALVRRAVSVESVGRVSAICSDKTGTITEGRLRVTHVVPADGTTPARLAFLAGRASRGDHGDPLDTAILAVEGAGGARTTVATFPFTEERRRETAVVQEAGGLLAVTKGAAETVLAMTPLPAAGRAAWSARVAALAAEGTKVIAVASRPLDADAWAGGEPDRGFALAGLVACADPVRPGVADAVAACRDAGIHVVMVTGDHPATATAVARAIGLGDGDPRVCDGEALAATLADPATDLRRLDVVARALPQQKLDLVRALQAAGETVVVTGDGVNDVPALQAADVGVAMGERGVRSAREAAAIVLLDDDFGTIVRAIAEGRQLVRNLRRSFQYLVAVHVPLVLTAALVPLLGWPLLYLPIHIAWLELLIHPTAMLVFQDLPDGDGLARWARRPPARIFDLRDWAILGATGLLLTLLVLGGYERGLGAGRDVEHARAVALAVLGAASAGVSAAVGGLRRRVGWIMAAASLLGTATLIQVPFLARVVVVEPLHVDDWLLVLAGTAVAAMPLLALRGRRGGRIAAAVGT